MDGVSRRTFLKSASASVVGALVWSSAPRVMANPLGLPIGLQLYSVRELLPKDYEATLRQVAALGYQEVEAAGFFNHSASDVKQAMEGAGLHCVSAHYGLKDLLTGSDEILAYGRNLGLQFIVCASPLPRNWASVKDPGSRQSRDAMTIDDWRWNAEQFNRIGERVSAAGMRFAYTTTRLSSARKTVWCSTTNCCAPPIPPSIHGTGLWMGGGRGQKSRRLPRTVSHAIFHAARERLQP